MEPSRKLIGVSSSKSPWLMAAAFGILAFSAIVVIGFVRGYLSWVLFYSGQGPLTTVSVVIITTAIIPVFVSIAGALMLLLSSKTNIGIFVSLSAIGTYLLMDVVYISLVWDGHHVIQSYTNAEWFVRSLNSDGNYTSSIFAYYFVYIPALLSTAASLLYGKKKLRT